MLVVCGQATGDTFNGEPLPPGGATFSNLVAQGGFEDTYDFQLSQTRNLEIGVGNLFVGGSGAPMFDIDHLAFALYDSGGNVLSTAELLIYNGFLGAGGYHFTVSGAGVGTSGGFYGGGIKMSAVPEAEVWVMMAAGLGLLGLKMGRRQRSQLVT